ncbi:MAG: hypothetical protein AAB225_00985 [Acidobacteriota bacterium]
MLGKALRLRRIFAQGRALIVDCDPCADDPLGKVRLLSRNGVDAIVLTPGLLDRVAEELAGLSVILRIDGGAWRGQHLVSVQAALEMGAEAVFVSVDVGRSGPSEALDRFGRITEDARRLGMPVFAEMASEDWLAAAHLGADYGADVIQTRSHADTGGQRSFVRTTGMPLVVAPEESALRGPGVFQAIWEIMQGPAQGLTLFCAQALDQPDPGPMLQAVHALVHQGVSVEEAAALARA